MSFSGIMHGICCAASNKRAVENEKGEGALRYCTKIIQDQNLNIQAFWEVTPCRLTNSPRFIDGSKRQ